MSAPKSTSEDSLTEVLGNKNILTSLIKQGGWVVSLVIALGWLTLSLIDRGDKSFEKEIKGINEKLEGISTKIASLETCMNTSVKEIRDKEAESQEKISLIKYRLDVLENRVGTGVPSNEKK